MKQAKTLNERELKAVFVQIGTRRFAARDRAIVAVSYYAGLRSHEIAALTTSDVLASDGTIRNELVLLASQTKGRESRKIFVSEKLRKELAVYVRTLDPNSSRSLFITQKDNAFTPNAMCHLFRDIYAECGIANASSPVLLGRFTRKGAETPKIEPSASPGRARQSPAQTVRSSSTPPSFTTTDRPINEL